MSCSAGICPSRPGGSRASSGGSSCGLGGSSAWGFHGGAGSCGLSWGPSAGFGGGNGGGFGSCCVVGMWGAGSGSGAGFARGLGLGGGSGCSSGASGGFCGYGGGLGGGSGGGDGGLLPGNEKQAMQNLNDRLASYLDKVRALEEANTDLENKIKGWYDKLGPGSGAGGTRRDYSHYFSILEDLRKQVAAATAKNARTLLQTDNARLAAEDFRMKYETELCLRRGVEADVGRLRGALDALTVTRSDLEARAEALQEELLHLRKDHAQEMKSARGGSGGAVSVEMNAAPGVELTELLDAMRAQYEQLAEQNRREVEQRYRQQSASLRAQICTEAAAAGSARTEISELRRALQALEIELQSQLATKSSLEGTLADTEAGYAARLSGTQMRVCSLEEQLCQARGEAQRQRGDHERLLGVKMRLEREIETYRRLLDGQASGSGFERSEDCASGHSRSESPGRDPNKTRVTKTIIEEVVDGRVVSSHVSSISEVRVK